MPHSEVLSRLFVEKIIDLMTIALVGALASVLLQEEVSFTNPSILMVFTFSALAVAIGGIIAMKFFSELMLRCLGPIFQLAGKRAFFERHIVHLVQEARRSLTLSRMALPSLLTLVMWLSVYAISYQYAAQTVGVVLTYPQTLVVIFGGTLGLMLPAAPSGRQGDTCSRRPRQATSGAG